MNMTLLIKVKRFMRSTFNNGVLVNMSNEKKVDLTKYVNPAIADDLTTNDSNKVLSAKQGKKLQDEKVAINQGSGNNGKFLKVNSSGNVACESVTIPSAYSHPSEKQCNYAYSHPTTKQCNASIPTGSSTATDIKMNGTQSAGSSSNFAKADHVHPTDTSRAAASHNQDLSTINNTSTMAVVITYTDSTSETKNFVIYTGS